MTETLAQKVFWANFPSLQRRFNDPNLVTRWKRVYRRSKANEVWYLLTNLESLDIALQCYSKRFAIEPMFKDFKSGGYHLADTQLNGQRFLAITLLIAMAYTLATDRGKQIRLQQVANYVGRVREPQRQQKRHSDFWIGLYGQLWIDSIHHWSNWADQLMRLKPQKGVFFLQGLKAMRLIESVF